MEGTTIPAAAPPAPPSGGAAPEAVESVGAETAEAPEASPPQTAEPVATPEPEPAPEPEQYDWDSWGGTLDEVPEHLRTQVEPVYNYFQPKLSEAEELRRKHDTLQTWFDALGNDDVDPVVTELRDTHESLKSEYETLKSEYEEAQASWEAYVQQEAEAYEKRLRAEYKDLFEDPVGAKALGALLDADMDPEMACKAASNGKAFADKVLEYKQGGSTDGDAIKLAEYEFGSTRTQPRAAQLVDDGSPSQRNGRQPPVDPNKIEDPHKRRLAIAQRAFAKHAK